MTVEGKDDEGKVPGETEDKHPESVPWSQHVAAKETIGGKLKASEEKVKGLEEQLKNAPNAEEASKIKEERDTLKTKLQEKEDEATKATEKSATELRETLKKDHGLTEEQTKDMSEAEMKRMVSVLGSKPKSLPDFAGGGGGSGELKGSPMELARQGYEQSGKNQK